MDTNKYVRLSGIAYESLVNGSGLRRVLFAQGCRHNCEGCFNKDTHDFNGGRLENMDNLIEDILKNPMLKGVTFSGGDPFEQADKFQYIAKRLKKAGLNIWCYTGYKFEFIIENMNMRKGWSDLINNVDVIVDGKFEQNNHDPSLKFKGSSNQRIINVKESLRYEKAKVLATA